MDDFQDNSLDEATDIQTEPLRSQVHIIHGGSLPKTHASFANVNKTAAKKFNQVSVKDILNAKNVIVELSAIKKYGKVGA